MELLPVDSAPSRSPRRRAVASFSWAISSIFFESSQKISHSSLHSPTRRDRGVAVVEVGGVGEGVLDARLLVPAGCRQDVVGVHHGEVHLLVDADRQVEPGHRLSSMAWVWFERRSRFVPPVM